MGIAAWLARFAAMALVAGCTASSSAPSGDDGVGRRADAIVGGQLDTTHPAVMLQSCRTSCLCTGTLVQKDESRGIGWLVTAAHCVPDPLPPADGGTADAGPSAVPRFFVQGDKAATFAADLANVIEPGAIRYPVLDWARHPAFAPGPKGHANDIAVVRVLGVGKDTPTMTLGGQIDGLLNKLPVVDVGYGSSGALGDLANLGIAGTRQRADVLIKAVEPTLVVVDGSDPGGSINLGDDGGPVILSIGGVEAVIGVHSTRVSVSGGARQENTRVSAMRTWLDGELVRAPAINDCNSCLRNAGHGTQACAPLTRGCLDNAPCNAYALCVEACADESGPTKGCRDGCLAAHPSAAAFYTPGLACACESCKSVCGATCEGLAERDAGAPPGPSDAGPPSPIEDRPADTGCSTASTMHRGSGAHASLACLGTLASLALAAVRARRRRAR